MKFLAVPGFLFYALIGIAQVPTSGLIGAWTFSSNANDVSGNGNHGSVTGASLTADRCGTPNSAYQFNGSSYIVMQAPGPLGNASRSISFWAKTTSSPLMVAFDYGFANGSGGCFQIVWNYNCSGVGIDVSNQALIRNSNCLLNNKWHHIVAVHNSSLTNQISNVLFYIDGVAQSLISCNVSGTTAAINTVTLAPVTIGKAANSMARYFNGALDDFYFYNRILTPSEVLQLYNINPCTPPVFGNTMVCSGSTNIYSVTPISGASYTWTLPGGWTGTSSTNTISTTSGTNSGVLSVVASSSCGALGTSSMNVTSQNVSGLVANANSTVLCSGNTITLTASGAQSYTWQPGNITGSVLTSSPGVTTVYSLTGMSAAGCTNSITKSILVPPTLSLITTASSPTACAGSSVVLTGSASGGLSPLNYSWVGGSTNATYSATKPTAGNYIFTLNVQDASNCTITRTIAVTFSNNPVFTPFTVSVCPASTGTLVPPTGFTYTWIPSGLVSPSFTANPTTSTTYSYIGGSINSCTASGTAMIFVKPAPTLSFTTYSITCASLGSATVNATGGTGPFSFTWMPSGQNGSSATGLSPGIHSITVLDNGTGCVYTPTTSFSPLIPLTGTVSATSSVNCNGANTGTALINLAGGSGNQSYTWMNLNGTQNTPTVSGLGAGIHSITVIDALTSCVVTKTFNVTQPAPVTVTIVSSHSVCLGGSIAVTALASGGIAGYNFTWSPGVNSNTHSIANGIAGIYTVNVNVSDANNCLAMGIRTVSFVNNPTITIPVSSVCPQSTGVLVASGAATYTWNTGATGSIFTAIPNTTTQYTVTGTALACTSSAVGTIFIKQAAVSLPSSNGPVCAGLPLFLTSNEPASQWKGPGGYVSTVQNPTIISSSVINTGNYTLTVIAANSCTATSTISVVVKPLPLFSVNASTVCEFQNLILFASTVTGASYSWSGPSFTSNISNPIITNATPFHSGHYSVVVTSSLNCSVSAIVHGSVVSSATAVITATNQLCKGSSLSLSSGGGNNYSWLGPNNFMSNQQNPTINNLLATSIFTLTVSKGPCVHTVTHLVTVHTPVSPTIITNSPICENTDLTLGSLPALAYQWSGPGLNAPGQNILIPAVSFSNGGKYSLTTTDFNGCVSSASIIIGILPVPLLTAIAPTVCFGEKAVIIASGADSYQWSGPNGYFSSSPQAIIATMNQSLSGTYSVTGTGLNGCKTTMTVNLDGYSYELPVASISSLNKACFNSKMILKGSGGLEYFWKGPAYFSATGQSLTLDVINYSMSGIYTLTVKNASNCTATSTVLINVYPNPSGSLEIDKDKGCIPLCTKLNLKVSGQNIAPIIEANYYINRVSLLDSTNTHCFIYPGVYTVAVNYKDSNQCVGSSSLIVDAYPKPNAEFHYTPVNPVSNTDVVQFHNNSDGQGITLHQWYLTGNDTDVVNTLDASFLYREPGNFAVILFVQNKYGCSDTMMRKIFIEDEYLLFIPNAFTPNGDGINDEFLPKGRGINKYNLQIFNRWGQMMFSTSEFSAGWNGTFSGTPCKDGVYVWKIEVQDGKGKTRHSSGKLTLLNGLFVPE